MKISDMIGMTFKKVSSDEDELVFSCDDGTSITFSHDQDCCESVWIEDVCGDLDDLTGWEIVEAEERAYDGGMLGEYDDSYTWTFYHFATVKGYVDVRFYGTSNGYYSESVDIFWRDNSGYCHGPYCGCDKCS